MKIYTRTGDEGETGLLGGLRNPKDSHRVEACGSIDEFNAVLGWCRCCGELSWVDELLGRVQNELFCLGAELATPPAKGKAAAPWEGLEGNSVAFFEQQIDAAEEQLAPLRQFVLPGGSEGASRLHMARTVCRRAERRIVSLSHQEPVRPVVLRYLNRLSDLLFVLARLANARRGVPDVPWAPPSQ